ncbi:hypothetical protein AB2T90_20590 [Clostridium butyricum]|uniref:hypothetical protein n=1 Tax=Clostridium butyricum TaxID=1492 RepID=UPI003467D2AC
MDITNFIAKLNKLDGNIYTIEEIVTPVDGVYEAELIHDNVEVNTINIYTESKLTGTKINTYTTSTPSLTPWKTNIKIFSTEPVLYVTYETTGDTVEAEDVNNLQDVLNETQRALNTEIDRAVKKEKQIEINLNNETVRATNAEGVISDNLDKEILRATKAEKVLTDNLNLEVERATAAESTLTNNLNKEITRAKKAENDEEMRATNAERIIADNLTKEVNRASSAESTLRDNLDREVERATGSESLIQSNIDAEVTRAKAKEAQIDNALADRYTKNQIFTKDEVLEKIQNVIGTAPAALDTLKEIADSLNNDSNFAGTMTNMLSEKVDKVAGKQLSTNDFDNTQKSNLADCNIKKHTHTNKSVLDGITSTLITAWNSAVTHISDTVKHITSAERTLWNTVSNKAEKSHTHTKSQITDMPTKVSQFTNDSGYITASDIDSSQNHTHANKTVLDGITSNKINYWDNKLSLSGGKVTGKTKFSQGTNVAYMATTTISGIYKHVAKITVRQNYQNQPITLDIIQRARFGTVIIEFKNSNTNDPELRRFTKIGELEAYLYKSATSTWELYIKMTEQYDCIDIMEFNKGEYMNLVDVTWTADTVTDLPTGYIKADRAYMDMTVERSVRDTDGNQINTTYVKKGTTWNELEGI